MKRLDQEVSLVGALENISMMDLRSHPGEILTSVSLGKTFVVERNGKPIAVLQKLPGTDLTIVADQHGKVSYSL